MLVLALLVRALVAGELAWRELGLEDDPIRDMHTYLEGGRAVLGGDLTLESTYPAYAPFIEATGPERFHELYGARPLTNAPGYFYFVAGGLALGRGSPLGVLALQVLLGAGSCWLIHELCLRATGRRRLALTAALLLALHGPTVLFTGLLLRATVLTFLLALYLLLLLRWLQGPRPASAAAAGAALGLLHLTKTSLPLCAPLAVAVALLAPGGRGTRGRCALACLAGFLLLVSPLFVRAAVCGTAWLHNESFGHFNLVLFNQPGADGLHYASAPVEYTRSILARGGGSQLGTLLAAIDGFDDPWRWVRLELVKLRGFWHAYEAGDNVEPYDYPNLLATLRLAALPNALLLPLALTGVCASRPLLRRGWLLHAGVGVVFLTCLVAVPLGRYRLPAAPFLCGFAALALDALVRGPARRRSILAATLVGALGLAWLPLVDAVGRPHAAWPRQRAAWASWRDMGAIAQRTGHLPRAAARARRAALSHPLLAGSGPLGPEDGPTLRESLSLLRWAHQLCRETGDEEGQTLLREAVERLLLGRGGAALLSR